MKYEIVSKVLVATVVLFVLLTLSATTSAKTSVINFDDLPLGSSIGTNYDGLTFSSGAETILAPPWIGPPSPTNVFSPPNVFYNPTSWTTQIDFAPSVSRVGIRHLPIWCIFPTKMEAFDSSGNPVGEVFGTALNSQSFEYLEVSSSTPNIAYVTLTRGVGESGANVLFDNLEFDTAEPIPEFTTIALPVAGILGLLFFFNHRKRRKED